MTGERFDASGGRPERSLADLVVPRRPAGIPYGEGEDHDARELLVANGYGTTPEELVALLDSGIGIVQGAAARTLGALGERSAAARLERLARSATVEESVRAQAAFALARMQVAGAPELLRKLLELPFEASPGPLQAAGALAALGDPSGIDIVLSALESSNPVTAMIATRQLHAFAHLDGRELPAAGALDVYGAFARALERPERNITAEARTQLEALDTDRARELLAAHEGGAGETSE